MRDHTIGGLPRAWAHLLVDVRLALRSLRRDRSFALAAIGTLALAISLNATVFTVADAMLFRGYSHVRQNERLVYLQERSGAGLCCISYPDFEDWRAQARTFAGMAFVASNRKITFRDGNGRPSDLVTFLVSPNTFALLGVAPLLGRDFTAADAVPGAPQVAMLNHRFWTTRFARRADVIGSAVEINGMPATIVGVMPEGFDFPTQENLWMPIVPSPDLLQRGLTPGGFIAVGRLRAGVSRNEARAELETINRRLAAAYPATNRNLIPTVMTHSQANSGEDAQIIWGSVWAGAWFVLLIACANLANLTLVRTMRRWRELATRIALGAGQTRMMRLMLIEGVLLAALAAGIGWWITIWSVRVWAETTASQYQILDYTVDSRTLVYLLAVSLVAAILISLGPMVRVMQLGAGGALKGDARGVTQSLRTKHLAARGSSRGRWRSRSFCSPAQASSREAWLTSSAPTLAYERLSRCWLAPRDCLPTSIQVTRRAGHTTTSFRRDCERHQGWKRSRWRAPSRCSLWPPGSSRSTGDRARRTPRRRWRSYAP